MIFEDWGLIEYQAALDKQIEYVEKVSQDPEHPGFLIFCTHPAVVTIGRQTQPEDIFSWKGATIEVSRGGRATYHGPSQVVVYPILNLKVSRKDRKPQEIRGYMRALEQAIVQTLAEYKVESKGRTSEQDSQDLSDTGVWVRTQKIASLGIAVRKWISFHGAAINVLSDKDAFQGLNPCGYKSSVMTNLEDQLNEKIDLEQFKNRLKNKCFELL